MKDSATHDTVCDMYVAGEKVEYIAIVCGISRHVIRDVVRKRSLPPRINASKIPRDITDAILVDYAAGASSQEVGDKYGFHRDTIIKIVRRNGGTVRGRGGDHRSRRV